MTALIATAIAAQDLRVGDVIAPASHRRDTVLVNNPADYHEGEFVLINLLAPNPATVHQAMSHLIDHGLTRAIAHRVRTIVEHVQARQDEQAAYEFASAVIDLNAAFAPNDNHMLSRLVATASLKLATGLVVAEIGAEDAALVAESTNRIFLPPFQPTGCWVAFNDDGLMLGRFSCSDPAQVGEIVRAEFGAEPVYLRELSDEEL